jgi:hypothetical protein
MEKSIKLMIVLIGSSMAMNAFAYSIASASSSHKLYVAPEDYAGRNYYVIDPNIAMTNDAGDLSENSFYLYSSVINARIDILAASNTIRYGAMNPTNGSFIGTPMTAPLNGLNSSNGALKINVGQYSPTNKISVQAVAKTAINSSYGSKAKVVAPMSGAVPANVKAK